MKLKIYILSLIFLSLYVYSEEPWEREDIIPSYDAFTVVKKKENNIVLSIIYYYKNEISPKTVERCPFYISCSSFAVQAMKKYGVFIGMLYFIDRYFYRENYNAYQNYPFKETLEGIYKLDDTFYLE